jgi:hypothetical protein
VTNQTPDPNATSHEQSGGESPQDLAQGAAPARPDLETMALPGRDDISDRTEADQAGDGEIFGTVSNPNAGI